jgi:RecA/RadA recombinase
MSIDLKSIVNKLNAKWAKESKMPEGSAPRIQIASSIPPPNLVSTGIPALDRMLDGGVPEGEIICYYGDPGGGKTTSACLLAAEIQKLGGAVLWYQTESGFPEEGLRLAGVDKDRFIHIPAVGYGEDGFNIIKDILMDGKVPREEIKLVVVDSVAGLEPSNEANSVEENGLEGNTIGVHARMMSKFFRVLTGQGLLRGGCICCLINQERSQISSVPMPATQTGGRAVQYGAKIMVRFAKPKAELIKDSKGTIVGHTVKLEVTKNNTGYGAPYATG